MHFNKGPVFSNTEEKTEVLLSVQNGRRVEEFIQILNCPRDIYVMLYSSSLRKLHSNVYSIKYLCVPCLISLLTTSVARE